MANVVAPKSEHANENRADLLTQLTVINSCLVLSLRGSRLTTASEVSEHIDADLHQPIGPPIAGMTMRKLGIPTAISRGKARFKLDRKQLEALQHDVAAQVDAITKRIKAIIDGNAMRMEHIAKLKPKLDEVLRAQAEEKRLEEYIAFHADVMRQIPILERQVKDKQADIEKWTALNKENKRLTGLIYPYR